MKFNTIIFAILISVLSFSCGSDQLTKSKAEDIIKECQEKTGKKITKTNKYTYGIIDMPDSTDVNFSKFLNKHKELEKLGLVKISDVKRDTRRYGKSKGSIIEITLTPDGEKYKTGRVEDFFGKLTANFKSCEYQLIQINEIQEIPERNEAKVKVTFERFAENPFFDESNEKRNPKRITETLSFRKTTDGWKLCD